MTCGGTLPSHSITFASLLLAICSSGILEALCLSIYGTANRLTLLCTLEIIKEISSCIALNCSANPIPYQPIKSSVNLKAANGEIIAVSEAYETKQGALHGIEAVQRSCDAEIEDLTIDQATKEKQETKGIEEVCKEPTPGINDTVLLLDNIPVSVDSGSTLTFRGKLTVHDTVEGVGCVEINIMEKDRSFLRDDLLVSGATNNDGTFVIDWIAKQRDFWDNKLQIYATFKGTENYKPSKSDVKHMKVLWYAKEK